MMMRRMMIVTSRSSHSQRSLSSHPAQAVPAEVLTLWIDLLMPVYGLTLGLMMGMVRARVVVVTLSTWTSETEEEEEGEERTLRHTSSALSLMVAYTSISS